MRYCTRCGTPSNEPDCFCGGHTADPNQLRLPLPPTTPTPMELHMRDRGLWVLEPAVKHLN